MCNCSFDMCADSNECYITYWCSKLNKHCITRKYCIENPKVPKMLGCYNKLKQQNLFENQENHNQ